MQDLVDYVDNIPDMMKSLNKNVSRLHVMEPNSSYNVAYSMRGNTPMDVNDRSNAIQVERMSSHALKAMSNVAKFPSDDNRPRTVEESSSVVMAKLKELKEKGIDVGKLYAQYDVNRTGKVSYKDFSDTLIATSSGLRKDETQLLASELDTKKVGSINYKDMLANLQDISSRLALDDSKKVGSINYRDILTSLKETAPLVSASPEKRPTRAAVTSQALVVAEDRTDDWSNLAFSAASSPIVRRSAVKSAITSPIKAAASIAHSIEVEEGGGYLSNYTSMLAAQQQSVTPSASTLNRPAVDDIDDNASYLSNYERYVASTPVSRRSVTSTLSRPRADSNSLLAFAANSPAAASKVAPNTSVVPLEIVNIQDLSASLPSTPYRGSRSVCSDISYQQQDDTWPMSGRRMFSGSRHRNTESPYYTDPTPQERRLERKRSHSAPPRARPLAHVTDEQQQLQGMRSASDVPSFKHSLRSALVRSASATPSINGDDVDDAASVGSMRSGVSSIAANNRAPYKRELLEQQEAFQRQLHSLQSKTTENGIVDQLGGRLNQLRHVLRQQDRSRSGCVNKEEFHTALRKSGVMLTKNQVTELYDQLAKESPQATIMGYTDNKSLNIESFVNRVQSRTVAPAFSHVNAVPVEDDDARSVGPVASTRSHKSAGTGAGGIGHETIAERAARAEELRIVKKILHSANKSHDPHRVFQQIDRSHVGWIGVKELKEALDHLDANLSPNEYTILMNKIEKTDDGKINLTKFEQVLHSTVTENDRREMQQRQQALRESKFYSSTYQTSKELTTYDLPEYDTLAKSPSFRKETLLWSKLKSVFQSNQKQVLAAFVPEANRREILNHYKHGKGPDVTASVDASHVTPLTVTQLERNLEKVGVRLGSEDVNQLRQHLRHRMEQPTASNVEKSREERVGKDATVSLEDFCSLMNIDVNINHRDTLELRNPRDNQADGGIFAASRRSQVANPTVSTSYFMEETDDVFHDRRKKVPQVQHVHHTEPSRFWEFTQCPEVAVLYPQPMASLREPFPDQRQHPIEKKNAVRGLVVPDTGRVQAEMIKSGMVVQENELIRERRRSVSVPRNASRSASIPYPPVDPVRNVNNSMNVSQSLDQSLNSTGVFSAKTSEHISKWASSSLADYFDSKSRQQQQRVGSSSSNVGNSGSGHANPVTLRRIVQQSSQLRAPFATDM